MIKPKKEKKTPVNSGKPQQKKQKTSKPNKGAKNKNANY